MPCVGCPLGHSLAFGITLYEPKAAIAWPPNHPSPKPIFFSYPALRAMTLTNQHYNPCFKWWITCWFSWVELNSTCGQPSLCLWVVFTFGMHVLKRLVSCISFYTSIKSRIWIRLLYFRSFGGELADLGRGVHVSRSVRTSLACDLLGSIVYLFYDQGWN